MRPARALFITERPDSVARLLPYFVQAGFEIHVLAPSRSRLRWSRAVDCFVALAVEPAPRAAQLREFADLIETRRDITICGDDDIVRLIARSDLDERDKLALLPIAHARYLHALGSKSGMAEAMRLVGVDQPRFEVVNEGELAAVAERLGLPVIAKVDDEGGGAGIVILETDQEVVTCPLTPDSKPLLVEELIHGQLIGIDALYLDGILCSMPVARTLETMKPLGVSVVREFKAVDDDRLVKDLRAMGQAVGAHGFVNVSAIRRPNGSHCIFEFDMRPNSWHAYADALGVDIVEVLKALATDLPLPEVPIQIPKGRTVRVRNLSRTYRCGFRPHHGHADMLLHPERMWPYVRRGDLALSAIEGLANLGWVVDHLRISMRLRWERVSHKRV